MQTQQAQIDFSVNVNSLHVYRENVLPTLSNRQREVLEVIEVLGKATCQEVCEYLTKQKGFLVTPNQISGRVGELKKLNKIEFVEKKYCNGRPHDVFKIVK